MHLDLSHCINLTRIGLGFCSNANIKSIKLPNSLEISPGLSRVINLQELDCSTCKDIKIYSQKVDTLRIYSIDNIGKLGVYKIHCRNLHILNIMETKMLDLSFTENLQNVYLPEGEYCIVDAQSKKYSNVKFYLGDAILHAGYFTYISPRVHSYLPIQEAMIDAQLDTI